MAGRRGYAFGGGDCAGTAAACGTAVVALEGNNADMWSATCCAGGIFAGGTIAITATNSHALQPPRRPARSTVTNCCTATCMPTSGCRSAGTCGGAFLGAGAAFVGSC